MPEVLTKSWLCNRCQKVWARKLNGNNMVKKKPICCPSCASPYWDSPRVYKKRNEEEKKE